MLLSEWIEKNKINRSKFSEDLGISRNHLYELMKGKYRPRPDLAEKIEKATDGQVTVMELLFPERFQ